MDRAGIACSGTMLLPVLLLLFTGFPVPHETAAVRNPETMIQTLPAYAITEHLHLLNATECLADLHRYRDSVDRGILWSLRMLDASGQPGPAFMNGNNYWLGDRLQCDYLDANEPMKLSDAVTKNNSLYRNPDEEYPPYPIRFYAAYMVHNSTIQYHIELPLQNLVTLGLCLPASCTTNEIGTLLTKVLADRTLMVGQLFSTDFQLTEVSDLRDDHQWLFSGRIIAVMFIIAIPLLLGIVGTTYDLLVYQKQLRKKQEFLTFENNNTSELKHDMEEKHETDQEEVTIAELKPQDKFGQILLQFSCYTNLAYIFKVEKNSEGISAFHGLKFFGNMWIIMVHTIYYSSFVSANRTSSYFLTNAFGAQILANATLSVDTFFFMGGFLLAHIYLKSQQHEKRPLRLQNRMSMFIQAVIKRYIRLTPPYLTVILLSMLNFSWYDKNSIHKYAEPINELCTKYWWRNILYINNLFDWQELCLTWSWYLSNDMQYFIFGSLLLILSSMRYLLAVGLGVAALCLSIAANIYEVYSINYTFAMNEQYETLSGLYSRPWFRISPYLIGLATAQLLSKWNYKLRLSKKTLIICWSLGIICNLSVLFGTYDKPMKLGASVAYAALSRGAWGVGIAWLVIACCTNNAGIINKFLSLPIWIPLSKLTYSAYLLNPFLIISVAMMSNYPLYVEFLTTGSIFLGILMCSYICAVPLSLIAEVPPILFLRYLNNLKRRAK